MTRQLDYTIFYKESLPVNGAWAITWDLFISAFNSSERVNRCFAKANAGTKHWIILPEYRYESNEFPQDGPSFAFDETNEAELVQHYFSNLGVEICHLKICIDTTGFMRPQLIYLTRFLMDHGVDTVDMLYAEPVQYQRKEQTRFSDEEVVEIRQIAGYEGTHIPDISNDVLIIGSGYDHELIAHVAENKDHARKIQVFGFPSLRPDMYQENVLRAQRAAGAIGGDYDNAANKILAPANDRFATAQELHHVVNHIQRTTGRITNLYLSPLATKPQALGFALYHLTEHQDSSASIIFPFCRTYSRETSLGLSRVSRYVVEIGALRRYRERLAS
jgi:hypothetical protein